MNTSKLTLKAARKLIADDRATNGGMPVEIRRYRSKKFFVVANYTVWCRRPAHDNWDGWECHGHFASAKDAISAALELAEIEAMA